MKAVDQIGRYRIDALLGSGAMGDVYRAYDPIIDRPVAIKVIRPELIAGSGSEQWLQRFRREARAAGRRFHPNIVAILDFGDDNGVPFLAMEYVDGRSLDVVIKTSSPLEPSRSVTMISQVLSALGFAHQNGIIHRDVKPSNILVLSNNDIKVADFGIARIDASEFTIVGDLLGTPAYMAPEQFSGAPIDERTDLFAAGVIFYEMLTGVKPFRGKSVTEIMSLMETRGPEDIGAFNPAVPDQLRQVIAKALAFDPSSRFSDAGAFAKAIADGFPNRTGQLAEAAPASFVQTTSIPAAGEISLVDASPGPENLARIERELATFIGPVASIAVKRATTQTHNIEVLYDLLAMYIDNQRDRAEFLKLARRGGAGASDLPRASVSVERHPTREQSQIVAKAPSPSAITAIEMSLTQYLGPIAKLLVRRELQKFETMESFCRVLAVHIPDEGEREAFLRTARQHLAARA